MKTLQRQVPRLDGEISFREKEEDGESSSEPQRKHMTTDRYKHLTYVEEFSMGLRVVHPQGWGECGLPVDLKRREIVTTEGKGKKGAFTGGIRRFGA